MRSSAWAATSATSVATLRAALAALDAVADTRLLRASHFYRTPAWGVTEQPDFLNAVAMLRHEPAAARLLAAMLDIERAAGRDRRADGSDRWGPRTLDLDLLLYGDADRRRARAARAASAPA